MTYSEYKEKVLAELDESLSSFDDALILLHSAQEEWVMEFVHSL